MLSTTGPEAMRGAPRAMAERCRFALDCGLGQRELAGFRRRWISRAIVIGVSAAVSSAVAATVILNCRPLVVWNASASMPRGLYFLNSSAVPSVGDTVVAMLPPSPRKLAAERQYLPANIPLVKRVAAVSGDLVCANQNDLFIDGHLAARRLRFDPRGLLLPRWEGCRILRRGDYFLLSNHPFSFDGRYFGVSRKSEIIGAAVHLWPR